MTYIFILICLMLVGSFVFVIGAIVFSAISGYVLMIYGIIVHIIKPLFKGVRCLLKPIFHH